MKYYTLLDMLLKDAPQTTRKQKMPQQIGNISAAERVLLNKGATKSGPPAVNSPESLSGPFAERNKRCSTLWNWLSWGN
jgi:hypothetical protein